MLLRTRISLLVILAFVIVCTGLALASFKREELITAQYSDAMINDRATLWHKIRYNQIQHMEDKAWLVADNQAFRQAIYSGDRRMIQQLGTRIVTQLRDRGLADRFDALYADGSLAYSSQSAVFQNSIIAAGVAKEAISQGIRIRGVGNDKQRNVAVVLGIPLEAPQDTNSPIGMGVYATNIDTVILAMEKATASSVLIVNRHGRLLAGATHSALWEKIGSLINLSDINTLQTIKSDDRVYSVIVLSEKADLGNLVGRLINIKDVTSFTYQQEQVSHITIGAVIVFLCFVLISLNYYVFRSFSPLTEGVNVLHALSHGDLRVQIEKISDQDEVGQIADAVNVFRADLIAFERFRRSRERQRRHQERFIRREMTRLAATLDEEERENVLTNLDQLEQLLRKSPGEENQVMSIADATNSASAALAIARESDSLAMTALAFQNMSERVQDQNHHLREALAAKNAFVALQKELDIAARVQLSLLPKDTPSSEVTEIAGTMKPAKEIGGDFYDFFRLDTYRIGVVVADVSGKGVPAALFMVMARTLMRATARHLDSPGQVLARVNDFLDQHNREELFVTMFYGVLDERTGRFVYANGGHNPPILIDSRGVHSLEITGGVVLGMFGGLDYDDTHVDLEPEAQLILFTDGVTEAFNPQSEAFGQERLIDTVQTLFGKDPERNVADIVANVEDFAGEAPQFDDITCVVLCFKGA